MAAMNDKVDRPREDWRYDVLAQGKVISADAITSPTYNNLLELNAIDVGGFRTARLFVRLATIGGTGSSRRGQSSEWRAFTIPRAVRVNIMKRTS
jgi:hypothetical protein